jgi:hypothetical protein
MFTEQRPLGRFESLPRRYTDGQTHREATTADSERLTMADAKKQKRRSKRQREREQEPAEPLRRDASDPRSKEPHHALANPASGPDETEFPDPYERRPDPRDPRTAATPASPEDEVDEETLARAANPRAPSTSEPHPPQSYDELKPVKGDR